MEETCDILFQMSQSEHLREMALMGIIQANPRMLPNGARIEVITSEYKGTGEEPHFHLFPANHKSKAGKANNYDLITRVALTKELPEYENDIHSIKDNNPVPKEYQKAIFKWSKEIDEESGLNNWKMARLFWNKQAASFRSGQV